MISFEGIDGSGKSTQAVLLKEKLESIGHTVLLCREPGGTPLSERVRNLLLDSSLEIGPFAELLLFSAARSELVRSVIVPALERGETVILDRFYDSTVAYQGAGRQQLDPEWIAEFSQHVTGGLRPDRTYYIAVTLETAFGRIERSLDRMESTGDAFFERVIQSYEGIAIAEPDRFRKLDGERSADGIHDQVWQDVQSLLGEESGTVATGRGKATHETGR